MERTLHSELHFAHRGIHCLTRGWSRATLRAMYSILATTPPRGLLATVTVMKETRRDDQCIELDRGLGSRFFSVAEYEKGKVRALHLSSPKARSFHEVIWTEGAPAVEDLSIAWLKTRAGKFRICARDVYDAQMRVMIGLD
jgi:hypothetical protein